MTRYLTTRQAREKGALVLTLKDRADRQDEWLGPYAFEYRGAIYHLMSRGDRREAIFRDDADRRHFITALGEVCAKTDWQK